MMESIFNLWSSGPPQPKFGCVKINSNGKYEEHTLNRTTEDDIYNQVCDLLGGVHCSPGINVVDELFMFVEANNHGPVNPVATRLCRKIQKVVYGDVCVLLKNSQTGVYENCTGAQIDYSNGMQQVLLNTSKVVPVFKKMVTKEILCEQIQVSPPPRKFPPEESNTNICKDSNTVPKPLDPNNIVVYGSPSKQVLTLLKSKILSLSNVDAPIIESVPNLQTQEVIIRELEKIEEEEAKTPPPPKKRTVEYQETPRRSTRVRKQVKY
jgi:hypothetical protein